MGMARSFAIIACFSSAFAAGCGDDSSRSDLGHGAHVAEPEVYPADDIRTVSWLEVGDRTAPEVWLAALESNRADPPDEVVERFRRLIELASTAYLENPRMVANRTVQLGKMLAEAGQRETHTEIIQGFLTLPKETRTGTERILSDVAGHYINLRRGGLGREDALAELRSGQPAVDVAALGRGPDRRATELVTSTAQSPSDARSAISEDGAATYPTPGNDAPEILHVDASRVSSVVGADEVFGFVRIAAELSSYAVPDELPRVARLDTDEIARVLCGGRRCGAVAFFDDRTRTIYVDDRLDLDKNLSARSFVIHEVVHYLHLLDGKLARDMPCHARLILEQEAYTVQNEFLAREGSRHRINTRLLDAMCRSR